MWLSLREQGRTADAGAETVAVALVVKLPDDHAANTSYAAQPGLPCAMGDLFSLSLLQILSVLSFLTSLLAVVRVGSVSLHRLSSQHKFEADVPRPESTLYGTLRLPSWNINWSLSGLPGSFSLGALIGEDESRPQMDDKHGVHGGYTGGADLVRMDWQLNRNRIVLTHPQHSQPPISMAKLIMSRHFQRKAPRVPRRMPGMPRPTPPSRLASSVV